jgi:hypothetical protein
VAEAEEEAEDAALARAMYGFGLSDQDFDTLVSSLGSGQPDSGPAPASAEDPARLGLERALQRMGAGLLGVPVCRVPRGRALVLAAFDEQHPELRGVALRWWNQGWGLAGLGGRSPPSPVVAELRSLARALQQTYALRLSSSRRRPRALKLGPGGGQ